MATDNLQEQQVLKLFFNPEKTNKNWDKIDGIEKYISSLPVKVTGDLTQMGTPGIYSRRLFLPAGTLLTSCIHKTHHQYCISQGLIIVYNTVTDETNTFKAGDWGVTYPGTRRVLYTLEDTVWFTFHPTDKIPFGFELFDKSRQEVIFTDIMSDILQAYYNPLIMDFEDGIFI